MKTKSKPLILGVLITASALMLISVPEQAFGAVDMFIKIGDIKGESTDRDHKDEIDVLAWSWGVTQSGSFHAGGGGGAGKVSVQDLSFTKYLDKSSPLLMQSAVNGEHIPEVELTVRKAGDKPVEYLVIKMTDVMVTSYSTGGSGGEDRLTESVSLNFAQIEFSYVPIDESGQVLKPITATYRVEDTA